MSRTHLVIPDSHAHPDFDNKRFEWLGKFIVDLRPDVIINLGDQADMASLCSYDRGTKGFEGRRYKKDIQANIEANELVFKPLHELQDRQRRGKRKIYKPETYFCLGNHENRINRVTSNQAELDGTISIEDLKNHEYYDEVIPFLQPLVVDGIVYQHYFTSGVMNSAISGVNPARMMLNKGHMSCTCGHSHLRDFAEDTRWDGKKIQALVAGVFQDYEADYAGPANALWWSGLIVKRQVTDGNYDLEFVSMEQLKEMYDE